MVKVLFQVNTKDLAKSSRHIHASGEITIQLNTSKDCRNHKDQTAAFPIYISEYRIYKNRQTVCDYQLFEIAPKCQLHAKAHSLIVKSMSFVDLLTQLLMSGDRSLENLREKEYPGQELQEILLCLIFSPVHICQIPHHRKCIIRNTQWHNHCHPGWPG